MSKIQKHIVVENKDEKCPRCGVLAEAREHNGLSEKILRQSVYYTKWFNCRNRDCKTSTFMLDIYKVVNSHYKKPELVEMYEQQSFWSKNL